MYFYIRISPYSESSSKFMCWLITHVCVGLTHHHPISFDADILTFYVLLCIQHKRMVFMLENDANTIWKGFTILYKWLKWPPISFGRWWLQLDMYKEAGSKGARRKWHFTCVEKWFDMLVHRNIRYLTSMVKM